jgi:hypothetical protein
VNNVNWNSNKSLLLSTGILPLEVDLEDIMINFYWGKKLFQSEWKPPHLPWYATANESRETRRLLNLLWVDIVSNGRPLDGGILSNPGRSLFI